MNRPARFTVADLRRALKAAEQQGPEWRVDVAPDGTITIVRRTSSADSKTPVVPYEVEAI